MAKIVHVGHGYWGRNLARNFHELGCLHGVVDQDAAAAQQAAALYGVSAMSFEQTLADPDVEGISLASPASLHFAQARDAMLAGKHVYVEKPLALEVSQAEQLQVIAAEKDRILMVGHLMQYHPAYEKLREMVLEGQFGRLLYAYSNRLSLGKFRAEENVLWSFAPHDISMILGLFGMEPHFVTAQGNVSFFDGIADNVGVQMHFPSGGSAHICVSWMHPFKEQRLVVIGEKAMVVFEDSQPEWGDKLIVYPHRIEIGDSVPLPIRADGQRVHVPRSEPLKNECRHFIEAIDNDAPVRTDGKEGLAVLRVLDQAEKALRDNLALQGRVS